MRYINPAKMRRTATLLAACIALMPLAQHAYAETGEAAAAVSPMDKTRSQQPDGRRHKDARKKTGGGFIFKETARLLDMSPQELEQGLKSGKTLAAIAKERKGWSEEQYVKQLTQAAEANIDKALADGKIDRTGAEQLKAKLPLILKHRVNRPFRDRSDPKRPEA